MFPKLSEEHGFVSRFKNEIIVQIEPQLIEVDDIKFLMRRFLQEKILTPSSMVLLVSSSLISISYIYRKKIGIFFQNVPFLSNKKRLQKEKQQQELEKKKKSQEKTHLEFKKKELSKILFFYNVALIN